MATKGSVYSEEGMGRGLEGATIEVEQVGSYRTIDFSSALFSFTKVVREEIRSMEERMNERIDRRMNELIEKQNIKEGTTEEVIMLRSISREQAKEEIMELFDKSSDKLYYSDIVEALKLDLEEVVEIVEELKAEGEVGEAE